MGTQGQLVARPQQQLHRRDFPNGFIFGTSSSSYQYEGAAGRGPNIWDTFTHMYPEKIKDKSNGNIADLSLALYKEDVRAMKEMGVDAYRFSISWARVFPGGKLSMGPKSIAGIKYYNDLINMLLNEGVKPIVTLFHWDVPQTLEKEYGGFLSPRIVQDFCNYAELCFEQFGDRVKQWITLNEPWSFSSGGYASGGLAPGRCTPSHGNTRAAGTAPLIPHRSFLCNHKGCNAGDSGTEPYKVAHNLILAHAAAVKLYRQKYQARQKGLIGITNIGTWVLPYSESTADREAAQRLIDFKFGWFMDPLTRGRYPENMQRLVGDRLPKFTDEESKMIIGSYDFLGLNYFSSYYAINDPNIAAGGKPSYYTDPQARITRINQQGVPIGRKAASDWLYVYPKGIYDLLLYIKRKYSAPPIYITENGVDEADDPTKTIQEACCDNDRIEYHHDHLCYVKKAIKDGVNVKGYFVWSLLDNFEWAEGYTVRFGMHYVDYKDPRLTRHPKTSALWFKELLKK